MSEYRVSTSEMAGLRKPFYGFSEMISFSRFLETRSKFSPLHSMQGYTRSKVVIFPCGVGGNLIPEIARVASTSHVQNSPTIEMLLELFELDENSNSSSKFPF